jgi:spermidine synthase
VNSRTADPLSADSDAPAVAGAAVLPLAALLLVSGSCALVFQVVWIRELRLVFGATTAASGAVVAIFMAGLGAGNLFFGRRLDRAPNPLAIYALLEAGIAVSSAISPWLIDLVRGVYISLGGQAELGQPLATLVRLGGAALVLAVPTFLMGGTLPATASAVATEADAKRQGVALLYGLNTVGAVLGAMIGNFLLLEALGNRRSLWLACAVNVCLSAAAWQYSRRLQCGTVPQPTNVTPVATAMHAHSSPSPQRLLIVCGTSAVVGCVYFLMEMVWYRMLGPLLGGTTYAFGLILGMALLGIGIGGSLYSLCGRWMKPSLTVLAATCAGEALLMGIPFALGDNIALSVLRQQGHGVESFAQQVWNWSQIAAVVVLPASLMAGFQFPVLLAVAGAGRADVGRHVGWTFASNTAGAIAGSLAGGFVALPLLTAPGVWRLSVGILVVLAAGHLVIGRRLRSAATVGVLAMGGLAIATISQTGPTAVWRHSGIGAGRAGAAQISPNEERDFSHRMRRRIIWEAEGRESSVAINAVDSFSFVVNGKIDGNAWLDAGTQIGLGVLGQLIHPAPERALVIGLGTGESAGWLALRPGMQVVDVVEMEPTVVHIAELCASVNGDVLRRPNVKLHFNDAREHLLTCRDRYDLIVSEPSNPYRAGIANLYTREFYESAAGRLADRGLFLQWLQGYEVDDRTVSIVLRTLSQSFPEVQVWQTNALDLVFVCGSREAFADLSVPILERHIQIPVVREGMHLGWGMNDLAGVFAHYVCGPRTIEACLASANVPLNTDDQNWLEYAFARSLGHSTPFSVDQLRSIAVDQQDDVPVPLAAEVAAQVTQRRLAMHLHPAATIPDTSPNAKRQPQRAAAFNAYLKGDFPSAAKHFQNFTLDHTSHDELVVFAHSLAESGQTVSDDVMSRIRQENPVDAAAINAIRLTRLDRHAEACDELLTAMRGLRESPWSSSQILESSLSCALPIAAADAELAQRLFEELATPFALHRAEELRQNLRFLVAEVLEPADLIAAIEVMEPNVPWNVWFLRQRARTYEAERHPLADRAYADLQAFLAAEAD